MSDEYATLKCNQPSVVDSLRRDGVGKGMSSKFLQLLVTKVVLFKEISRQKIPKYTSSFEFYCEGLL